LVKLEYANFLKIFRGLIKVVRGGLGGYLGYFVSLRSFASFGAFKIFWTF